MSATTVFHDNRRLAPWWMCALMLLIAAFFGYVISESYGKPANAGVATRFLIPPYCVWIYLVLGCLLNRQSIRVNQDRVKVATGPILMGMNETIPRDRIAFCYYCSILASSDDGGDASPFAIGHVAGVETRSGRQVVLVDPYPDLQAARQFANAIADALNQGAGSNERIEVRELRNPRNDSEGTRRAWLWGGIWSVAIVSGIVWELVRRYWSH